MKEKKLILLVGSCLLALCLFLGLYLLTREPKHQSPLEPQNPTVTEPEPIKTPIFDTFPKLSTKDTAFILFKEAPSFLLIDSFNTETGLEHALLYEKLNDTYGFANMVYVIDLEQSDFQQDEEGNLEFGEIEIPNKPSVLLIFEGQIAAELSLNNKTADEIEDFISQFYELNDTDMEVQ